MAVLLSFSFSTNSTPSLFVRLYRLSQIVLNEIESYFQLERESKKLKCEYIEKTSFEWLIVPFEIPEWQVIRFSAWEKKSRKVVT